MNPVDFKHSNKTLVKSQQDKRSRLRVWTDEVRCVSCWKVTWREWFSMLLFGKVWLYVWGGGTQPPVALVARKGVFLKSKKGGQL